MSTPAPTTPRGMPRRSPREQPHEMKTAVALLFATQIVGGALVLVGMVPLGLVILAPVIVNIFAFHVFLAPDGLPLATVVCVVALFLAWRHRGAYGPLFVPGAGPAT